MIIKNECPFNIYWQVFDSDDTAHALALKDGIVRPGEAGTWTQGTRDTVILRILRSDWGGPVLKGPKEVLQDRTIVIRWINNQATWVYDVTPGREPPPLDGIRIKNSAFIDVHAVLSFNGWVQEVKNSIRPGTEFVFGGSTNGTHDLTIIPGWTSDSVVTAEAQDAWNGQATAAAIINTAGVALAIAGAVVTFGAATPLLANLGVFVALGSLVQSGAGPVASVVAESDVLPSGLFLRGVPGSNSNPVIECYGAQPFGTKSSDAFVIQAVSPFRAMLWNDMIGGYRRGRAFPSGVAYDFYPQLDSNGGDVMNAGYGRSPLELKVLADQRSDVVAFNSNGWMKRAIRPQSTWTNWTTDTTKGLYVKRR